ncbi:hypothetical protein H5410_050308 [Solanum commersonii]|uniref:DUF7746 domain-containing protein n=1 Tax=Solanum commersonii TaxID=4109 RepID=A0A9J5WV42_SOLCO|nr:hypothetical protein H5410_050308 [Solanum commersonii]
MSILGEHIMSLHEKVDRLLTLLPTKIYNFIEGEPSKEKEFYDSLNKISEKYARKPVQRMFYYPRPTPQDVLLEEHEHIITNSYNGKEIYEWNIDGYTDRHIFTTVHRMLMYNTICKTNKNSDKTIADMITAGFRSIKGLGQLSQTARDIVLMAVKQEGDQVTQNAVYTLVLNIIEHFSGRWSDNSETIRTLLMVSLLSDSIDSLIFLAVNKLLIDLIKIISIIIFKIMLNSDSESGSYSSREYS